ncbi:MAG: universal stress protein [Solirubrobacteraceae bacterium]
MSGHPVVACYRGLDSVDAVQLGALLAGALHEPLVLASAYRYEPESLSARVLPPDNSRRAVAAQAALRRARTFAGTDIEVRGQIVPSIGVADALIALARDVDACVLVMGRDTQGHVTRSLIPRAPCPVAVAPLSVPLPQIGSFERIGVAYDGSPGAWWALHAARKLALATGARLMLLAAGATTEHAIGMLHVGRLSLGFKVEYDTRALVGEAPAALAQASGELDLLVCGSRGRGRPLAAILGSVSTHLVAHAQCPVLVVPSVVRHSTTGPLGITSAAANA